MGNFKVTHFCFYKVSIYNKMENNLDIIRELTEKLNLRDKKLRLRAKALNKIRKLIEELDEEKQKCEAITEIKNILQDVE